MAKFKYGYKKEPIYKRDMRYKTGARVIGYKHVIDRSNKILFNEKQIKISKIEGYIKIGFIIIAVGLIIYHINTADFKMKHMGPSKMISKLNDGDTLFSNKSYLLFYTKFKNKSINGFDFDKRGLDTINCYCFFISADSIQINKDNRSKEEKDTSHYKFEKFKPVYDYYFQVKPFENLITIEPEIYKSSDIINKNWYVKSSDVNIGIYKYNIENQSFNPESIKN